MSIDKKYFGIMLEKYDNLYSLGFNIMLHRRSYRTEGKKAWHIDTNIDFLKWFIEIRIGFDGYR